MPLVRKLISMTAISMTCVYGTAYTGPVDEAGPTLTLASISPIANTPITAKTVLVADLEYSVEDFKAGEYFVVAQVDTTKEHATTDGRFPNSSYPVLTEPHGNLRFSFPVAYVWDLPNVKHPLVVHFYLNKKVDSKHSRIVAKAGPIAFAE
jgi:hypothetical protein